MSTGDGFSALTVTLWTLVFAAVMIGVGWLDRQGRAGRIAARTALVAGAGAISVYTLLGSASPLNALPFAIGGIGVFALIAWAFCGFGAAIADARSGRPNRFGTRARVPGVVLAFVTSYVFAIFIALLVDCATAEVCD